MSDDFPINKAEKLDARAEFAFYELSELAAIICQMPLAFVNLNVKRNDLRVDFQEFAFEFHKKLKPFRVSIVEDASKDKQLAKNSFVKNSPNIRFYAGIPLIDAAGKMFGSLCVIDYRPRKLDSEQVDTLKIIARQIVSQYEIRRESSQNEHLLLINEKIIEGLQSELDALETAEILKAETTEDEKILRFSFSADWSKKPKFAEINATRKKEKTNRAVVQMLNNKRVLIADPSSRVRRLLRQYSVIWGLESVETSTGEETLKTLRRAFENGKPFELAVIDTSLPDREGFALARQIKTDAELNKTQIILMTAHGQRGDALLAAEIGVAGYLTKPLQGAQVFDCLVSVLANTPPRIENSAIILPSLLESHDIADKETAKEAFNVYLTETERFLEEIRSELKNENARNIERLTETLYGSSIAVGADNIAVISKQINENATKNELKKIAPLLENFVEEFSRLQAELVEIGDGLISFNQRI